MQNELLNRSWSIFPELHRNNWGEGAKVGGGVLASAVLTFAIIHRLLKGLTPIWNRHYLFPHESPLVYSSCLRKPLNRPLNKPTTYSQRFQIAKNASYLEALHSRFRSLQSQLSKGILGAFDKPYDKPILPKIPLKKIKVTHKNAHSLH